MIIGWVSSCGMRSIDMRDWGFVPPSRLVKGIPNSNLISRDACHNLLHNMGFLHRLEITSSPELKSSTRQLHEGYFQQGGHSEWTAFIIDQKKKPTVLFAFRDLQDCIASRLILEG